MDKKSINDWMGLGIFLLVTGLILAVYSVCTYVEIKSLGEKVDFELIDDNNNLSDSEKYYKYVTISDYLNQKLDKNANLPVKNTACIYTDYAQHNALELYYLTKKFSDEDKVSTAAGNVRSLYNRLDSYNTCKKTSQYKQELQNIITEIEKRQKNKFYNPPKMNNFLNEFKESRAIPTDVEQPKVIGNQAGYEQQLQPNSYESEQMQNIQTNPNIEQ